MSNKAQDEYRAAAERLYQIDGLSIERRGAVQVVSDGAYVEAMVWVPKSALGDYKRLNSTEIMLESLKLDPKDETGVTSPGYDGTQG
jgi:hypothetical protein